MRFDQNELRQRVCYHEAIMSDSLDNATAFFHTLNQLMRSTPAQIPSPPTNRPGLVRRLFGYWRSATSPEV
jgi:hypothetical protein